MTPEIRERIYSQAQKEQKRIAIPEASSEKILKAVRQIQDKKLGIPVLIGNPEEIHTVADEINVAIDGMEIIEFKTPELVDEVVSKYAEINAAYTEKTLRRKARDPMNFAMMMLAVDMVDGVFSGINYSTGDVLLSAQAFVGLDKDITTPSSMGIITVDGFEGSQGSEMALADCSVCFLPDEKMLADIAITTCDTVHTLLGWEPRAALVSFSTDGSSEHSMVDTVRNAVAIANEIRPDLKIDGEFQLDAALSPEAAAKKVKRPSEVAGKANIIVFPDLNSGNIGVKIISLLARGEAVGPLLQGFAKPVADCSRGATVEEIVDNIAILAARAQKAV